jgi:hypothetical protein
MSEHFRTLLPGDAAIDQQRDAAAAGVTWVDRRRRDFVTGSSVQKSEGV